MSTKIFNPQVSYVELGILLFGLIVMGIIVFVCRPISTARMVHDMIFQPNKQ